MVESEEKADAIWSATRDILAYSNFEVMKDLGLTITLNDLPFEKAFIYSWIKEGKKK